jgi:hypothetical protein
VVGISQLASHEQIGSYQRSNSDSHRKATYTESWPRKLLLWEVGWGY